MNEQRLTGGGATFSSDVDWSGEPPHDDVGAYVLDALPDDDRRRFEGHLASCRSCQEAVATLTPVVATLYRLDEPSTRDGEEGADPPAADAELRARILGLVAAEGPRSVTAAPVLPPAPPVLVAPSDVGRWRGRAAAPAWLLAAVFALATAGALGWGLTQRRELADQRTELALLRQRAPIVYEMETMEGAPRAVGRVVVDGADGVGMLVVHGLPALAPGRDYQVWLLEGDNARPSVTFDVAASGAGGVMIDGYGGAVDGVALTEEPDGGSETPTTPILMVAETAPRAG